MSERLPTALLKAIRYFADQDVCIEFVAKLRWTDGPVCPACGGTEHSYLTTRRLWKCRNKECHKQFSVKVGTIFEDSPIPLDKWLCAIWLIANSKNGISSYELHRAIGISQKSAWFVLHRVRLAMQTGSFARFEGETEADETFVGGKSKFMHKDVRKRKIDGKRGQHGKTIIVGTLRRGDEQSRSRVSAEVVAERNNSTIEAHVRARVEPGANLYTDKYGAYSALADDYDHETVDHVEQYVNGRVHTQGIENFWSLLKRGLHGSYVSVAPEHLFRYVDERVFTFNYRGLTDLGRFSTVLAMVSGKRLTYAELTGN